MFRTFGPQASGGKFIPPGSESPSPILFEKLVIVVLVLAEKKWPIEIEHVEKGVIIKDVDKSSIWTTHRPCLFAI